MLGGTSKAIGATGEFMSVKFSKAEMGVWRWEHILCTSSYSQDWALFIAPDMLTPLTHPKHGFLICYPTEIT